MQIFIILQTTDDVEGATVLSPAYIDKEIAEKVAEDLNAPRENHDNWVNNQYLHVYNSGEYIQCVADYQAACKNYETAYESYQAIMYTPSKISSRDHEKFQKESQALAKVLVETEAKLREEYITLNPTPKGDSDYWYSVEETTLDIKPE